MAKYCNPLMLDAALDYLATAVQMILCNGQPTTYAEATTNFGTTTNKKVAAVAMTGADFTKAAGTTSGRKVTTAAKNAVAVSVTTTADHVAFVSGTVLLYVDTLSAAVSLDVAGTVNIGAMVVEMRDPT